MDRHPRISPPCIRYRSPARSTPSGAGDTPSRRRIFVCRPGEPLREEAGCAKTHPLDAGAPRVSAAGHRRGPRGRRSTFYKAGATPKAASTPASRWRCARFSSSPEFLFRIERDPRERRAGHRLSHQRSGAGLAAVVLPLEQHPGRGTARRWPSRGNCSDPAVLEQQVRRMLADPRSRRAGRQLRRAVAVPAQSRRASCRTRGCSRTSTTTCGRRSGARRSCSSRASCARTAACSIC